MNKFLLFIISFAVYSTFTFGQGYMITVSSVLPSEITICGSEKTVEVEILNPSPFNLSNVVLHVTMPVGLNYLAGTVNGATELNITTLNTPVFTLANIPTQGVSKIFFKVTANCLLMDYIAQGNLVSIVSRVDYTTSNNITTYDVNSAYLFNVKQPNLSIVSITNQTYSGNIGDVFTRCITITNGGLGELGQFTFTHTHGNGIQVNSVSIGTWNSSGNTETVYIAGNNISGIGNNNNIFENAEVITICETIQVMNCVSVFSDYEVSWGCDSQECQNSISTANVIFPNFTPNLIITPTAGINYCLGTGNANTPSLRIINTGLGNAYDVFLDIFQSTQTTYNSGLRSNIDPASFTMQVNSTAPVSIVPTQTFANSAHYCLSASPKGRVYLNIPTINAHDTVIIRWNYYNCCSDACGGTRVISGWRYQGTYKSICNNSYVIPNAWGYSYKELYGDLVNDLSPSIITSGETKNFSFLFSSYGNSYPSTTGAHWKFVVTLPPCLSYAGNFVIQRYNGTQFWYPATVNVVGNILTATFSSTPPWNLFQAVVKFDLVASCANAGCVEGSNTLSIRSYFIPSGSCSCEVVASCLNLTVGIICPIVCDGLNNKGFTTYRSSYGLPDNNNDGLADAPPATLNFNAIRRDRAMFGDTITTCFESTVRTSAAHPSWSYLYAIDSIINGNQLGFVDGYLEIFQNSTGNTLTCNVNTSSITTAGSTRKFTFDLSPVTLIAQGLLPAGFTFNNDDSIAFRVRFKVTNNPGGTVIDCFVKNKIYLSDIPNPTSSAHKFSCNNFEGRFSIVGYYYTNWGPDNFNLNTCQSVTISQNYYLSIGPCCQNYAGGNLFPYEYRYWSHISNLKTVLPHGYQFISARFNQTRTSGTNAGSTSPWISITPANPNSDTLEFNVEPYFETFGGTLPLSDDGYYGTLQITVAPTCNVVSNIASNINHLWTFGPSGYLLNSNTPNTSNTYGQDIITYQGPDIFLQSNLPTVLAYNDEVSWDISLSNTTAFNAMNTWFAGDQTTGVTILQVLDLDNYVIIPPVGTIFQIGVLPANTIRHFRITATYVSCFPTQMNLYAGWNCNAGYPATIDAYPCTPDVIVLSLEPQVPNLIANVTSPGGTVDLCDTATYIVEGINVQLGTAYDLELKVILPIGVSIIPGSCMISYPAGAPYAGIPDPAFISGTQWKWDISALNAMIGADGLPGILDTLHNSVKISFKVITTCAYTSGSTIGFNFHGQSHCGNLTGQEITMSSQLGITGATAPYLTEIFINTSYVSPCAYNNTHLRVKIINDGLLSFGLTDSIRLKMPDGIFYTPNSFGSVYNAPVNPLPHTYMLNGQQYVVWKLPPNTQMGDSVVFDISYYCNPDVVKCGIYYIDALTYSSRNLLCQLTGLNCDIMVGTGSAEIPLYIYKSYLTLSDAYAYAIPNSPADETVYTAYTISNNGESIIANHTVYLSYFFDAEGNHILSPADVFLGADSINVFIDTNSVNPFTSHFNAPVGTSCRLIFVLDTTINPCICEMNQQFASAGLLNAGDDTSICSGQSIYIGMPAANGYSYQWQPGTGLSNPSSSRPLLTLVNNGSSPDTLTYILTTNRINCTTKDTIEIIVFPLPIPDAGTDQDIGACPTALNANLNGSATGTGPFTYSWSPASGLNNAGIANPVADPAATTAYTLTVTDNYGCSNTDSTLITVNPLPGANAGNDQHIGTCTNAANANLTGTGTGTAPLTYSWLPVAGLNNANSSNPVADPAATTTYTLTVTDNYGCTATDAVTITVDPLPTANAGADHHIGTCSNAPNANINGSGTGTSPLTYSWLPVTGLSNSGIANPIAYPAVTTTYTLMVTDTYGCTASDAVIITIDPLPVINAGADQNIGACSNAANANINAVATGTSPFTYTWAPVNGLSNPNSASPVADPTATTTYTIMVTDTYGCTATDDILITVDPLPTSNAGTDQHIGACSNAANANLTGTGTGTAPLTYSWLPVTGLNNPNIPNPIADPTATITYTLTITDNYGCTATDAVIITVDPMLTADAGADQHIGTCLNAPNANMNGLGTGTSPLTYSWSPVTGLSNSGISNPVADPAVTTTYTLMVTDTYGCTATDAVTITVDPLPVINAGADQNIGACPNAANANMNAIATGTAPFIYAWTPANGLSNTNIANPVADPTITTTYTIMVTDTHGCTATDNVLITIDPLPTSNAGNDQHIGACSNAANANLTGMGTGTAPLTYSWLPATGLNNAFIVNPVADPAGTTTYTLTATDKYGCTATDTVTITVDPLPTASAGADQHIGACSYALNANMNGSGTGTSPLTYSWTPVTGLNNSNISNPVADPVTTTAYTLTVTDIYGCTATDAVNISVDPMPTANAGADQHIGTCANAANANLTGTGSGTPPLTYSWLPATGLSNTGISNPVADPSNTTTYTLTVTDLYGCTATDAVIITVDPLPFVNAGADQNIGSCTNAANANITAVASGTAPLTYSWTPVIGLTNPNIANPVADPAVTTTYTVTVTDTYGCTAMDDILITVDPLPGANAGTDQHIGACTNAANANLAATGTGTAPLTYHWLPLTGLNNADIADPVANPATTTTYTLTLTDKYGCTATDAVTITVDPLPTANAGADQHIGACLWATNANLSGTGTGTATLAYSWLPVTGLNIPNTANPTADPANTTNYTLTITDTYGCTATDAVLITVDPLPVVSVSADTTVVCETFSAVLTATGTLTYSWSPAAGLSSTSGPTVTATPLNTTTYTVTGTDQYTCTAAAQITITVNPNPIVVISPPVTSICIGNSDTLTASGAASYIWAPGAGLSSSSGSTVFADPVSITTYTITGNSLGCTGNATIIVTVNPLPVVTLNPFSDVCFNDDILTMTQGVPAGGFYTGAGITGSDNFNPSTAGVGTHMITYTYTDSNSCVNTATQNITVNPVFSTNNPQIICDGEIYTFNSHNYSAQGTYLDTLSTILGCDSVIVTQLTVNPLPNISIEPAPPSVCLWDSISITAHGAVTYIWSPGIGLSNTIGPEVLAYPTTTTNYTVIGNDVNSCSAALGFQIVVWPLPVVNLTSDTSTICPGHLYGIHATEGFESYRWSNGMDLPDIFVDYGGYFTVQVWDTNNCNSYDTIYVDEDCQSTMFIPNAFTPNGDGMNDFFTIIGENILSIKIWIYNRWGELVFYSDNLADAWDGKHNGKYVTPGPFTWHMEFETYYAKTVSNRKLRSGIVTVIR
ncbi:MAG TPA: gliding motility-associated C-terminal domain-containing protein [Bacteroidales bacterium]|nr:gliding motility-associated C-terminal domain-containing protein [Bacteroidales bacterium]